MLVAPPAKRIVFGIIPVASPEMILVAAKPGGIFAIVDRLHREIGFPVRVDLGSRKAKKKWDSHPLYLARVGIRPGSEILFGNEEGVRLS